MRKTIHHIILLFGLVSILASCAASKSAAVNERESLSRKFGVEITKKDNIKLYKSVSSWLGVRYKLGGTTKKGVDCSGFAGAIYKDVYGISLKRTVEDIYANSKKIRRGKLKEGDLVFFRTDEKRRKKPNHVGIYLKSGKFAHASTSKGIEINNLDNVFYKKAFIKGGRVK